MSYIDKGAVKVRLIGKVADGLQIEDACKASGISYGTYLSWRKKDEVWSKKLDSVRRAQKAERIESLLEKLAQGHDQIEETETWTEENEAGDKVIKTRKVKKLPPNERAIAMLSKKYAKDFTGTDININHEIGITIKDRALTVEERLNILKSDKAEGQVIDIKEFKRID